MLDNPDVQVWYNTSPLATVNGARPGDEFEKVYHKRVPFQGGATEFAILANLFYMFNNRPPQGFNGRSMSPGDIIVIEQVGAWECLATGWRRIQGAFHGGKLELTAGTLRSELLKMPNHTRVDGFGRPIRNIATNPKPRGPRGAA